MGPGSVNRVAVSASIEEIHSRPSLVLGGLALVPSPSKTSCAIAEFFGFYSGF